jgi:glyoxylase-like metal-dependent hydrolase (beta-lactamase superfamily II)
LEIVSGVHQIDGVHGANSYLVVSKGSILVIDTGLPGNEKRLIEYIEKLGRSWHDVEYIVLTHADPDHSGSAAGLKQMTGAKVAIHEADALSLSGERELKKVSGILSILFKMMLRCMKFQPVKLDMLLKEGDEIGDFRVIHAPGHTVGSICLYQPGRLMFAGDVLRSDSRGNLKLPSKRRTLDMKQTRESVRKIAQLEFNILLPGHGKPVLQNASKMVRMLVEAEEHA